MLIDIYFYLFMAKYTLFLFLKYYLLPTIYETWFIRIFFISKIKLFHWFRFNFP